MRIGILLHDQNLNTGTSGVGLTTQIWYNFLSNEGHNVTYICVNKKVELENTNIIVLDEILEKYEDEYDKNCGVIEQRKQKYPELKNFDIVFVIGASDYSYQMYLRKNNVKVIYIMLGSVYHNDVTETIFDKNHTSIYYPYYDEVWICPHFKYVKEYYKVRYNTEKVYICPYLWAPSLLEVNNTRNKVLTDVENLRVAIMEPNLEQAKCCIIPMAICEKAEKYIQKVKIFNGFKLKDRKFFKRWLTNTSCFKNNKLSVENRYPLASILSEYCNCIVSCVDYCDMNNLFLECFYLGVPLIHNSPMLKDYGYYYPGFDVTKGAKQIENVIKNHNREEYIKRHESLLQKYSIHNPLYKSWVNGRLKGEIDFDCE